MNTVLSNIKKSHQFSNIQSIGFLSIFTHAWANAPKNRHCGHTGRAFNISFTSGRDSISKVSRCDQEGPELFVNTHYFIHSISLAEGRGHDRDNVRV